MRTLTSKSRRYAPEALLLPAGRPAHPRYTLLGSSRRCKTRPSSLKARDGTNRRPAMPSMVDHFCNPYKNRFALVRALWITRAQLLHIRIFHTHFNDMSFGSGIALGL